MQRLPPCRGPLGQRKTPDISDLPTYLPTYLASYLSIYLSTCTYTYAYLPTLEPRDSMSPTPDREPRLIRQQQSWAWPVDYGSFQGSRALFCRPKTVGLSSSGRPRKEQSYGPKKFLRGRPTRTEPVFTTAAACIIVVWQSNDINLVGGSGWGTVGARIPPPLKYSEKCLGCLVNHQGCCFVVVMTNPKCMETAIWRPSSQIEDSQL